jgi:hypothetical protein
MRLGIIFACLPEFYERIGVSLDNGVKIGAPNRVRQRFARKYFKNVWASIPGFPDRSHNRRVVDRPVTEAFAIGPGARPMPVAQLNQEDAILACGDNAV